MAESISRIGFLSGHFGFIILFALTAFLIGRRLTRRVVFDSLWEQLSVSVSLGLGAIASLTFFLGLCGLLYRSVVLIALAAWVAWSFESVVQAVRQIRSNGAVLSSSRLLLFTGAVFLAAPILVLPLYPPTQFDATMYFLATSRMFAEHHAVTITPYLRMPVLTQLNEMFFTLGLLFYDDIAAQLFQLLMLVIMTCAVIAFGRKNFSRQTGWWAAALLLANPAVLWCGSVAYVDISLALFATMSGYAFWNWVTSRKDSWLVLSGAFGGFAASTKYPGLFFVLFFGVITVYFALRHRSFSPVLRFTIPVIAIAAPWYFRNFYYTHDPVFPFLPQFFRSTYWSAEDVQGLVLNMKLYGVGHSPLALIKLPWSLAFHPELFFPESLYLPKTYFFFLPLVVVFAFMDVRIRKLLALIIIFVLFWAFSAQILRYLLPMLPILSVATAASFDLLAKRIPFISKFRSHWIAISIIFGVFLYGGWSYALSMWQRNGPIPVSEHEREQFLTARLSSFPAHKMLNNLRKSGYTLYSMQDENMAYFVNGTYMGDYFGPARYSRIWDKLGRGDLLYGELKSMNADFFLVNQGRMKINLPQDDFFQRHFKPLYESGDIRLFQLMDKAFQFATMNVLKNSDFEELSGQRLAAWQVAGAPVIDKSGQNSYSGLVAVDCNRAGDVIYQTVSVHGDADYSFSCKARSIGIDGTAKLQVNWSDANGNSIYQNLKAIDIGSKWTPAEVRMRSPGNAVTATVYLSPLDPSSVWFDDVLFGELEPRTSP